MTKSLSTDGHTITYEVTNAYPGWSSNLNCKIRNNGSVPANLTVTLGASSPNVTVSGYNAAHSSLGAGATSGTIALTTSVPSTVTEQNATYTFTLTVTGSQFNVTQQRLWVSEPAVPPVMP